MMRIAIYVIGFAAATSAATIAASAGRSVCPQVPAAPPRYTRLPHALSGHVVGFVGPNGRAGKNVVTFQAVKRDSTSLSEFVSKYFLHDSQIPQAIIVEPYENSNIDICGEAYLLRYHEKFNNQDVTVSQERDATIRGDTRMPTRRAARSRRRPSNPVRTAVTLVRRLSESYGSPTVGC